MKRLCSALLSSLIVALAACGEDGIIVVDDGPVPDGIVGGTETNYDIWRGTVALITAEGGMCSGTLIHPEVVLTAGHCVKLHSTNPLQPADYDYTADPTGLAIKSGANVIYGGDYLADALAAVSHPTWDGDLNPGQAVDLGLVHLTIPVDLVGYFCLRETPPQVGEEGVIVGYGLTGSLALTSSGIHRWGETTILAANDYDIEIGDPTGTCQGDSGGPLFTIGNEEPERWQISGVTSYGQGFMCQADGNSFSANTAANLEWIDEVLFEFTGDHLGYCNNCGPDEGGDCSDEPDPQDTDTGGDADVDADTDADADADGDADAGGEQAVDTPDSEGCGCRTAGLGSGLLGPLAALLRALF